MRSQQRIFRQSCRYSWPIRCSVIIICRCTKFQRPSEALRPAARVLHRLERGCSVSGRRPKLGSSSGPVQRLLSCLQGLRTLKQEINTSAFTYSSILVSRLRQWATKYDALLAPLLATMSSKDLRASTLLKIYHTSGTILATVCHNSNETVYDLCMREFDKILRLSESLIAAQHEDSVGYTSFSCEMGLICALVLTTRKCRHPVTRRKALALLKQAPPREGP